MVKKHLPKGEGKDKDYQVVMPPPGFISQGFLHPDAGFCVVSDP